MKLRILSIILVTIAISAIFVHNVSHAQTDNNTVVQYGSNCIIAQGELSGSVRTQDLKTRVYRVQGYQYIYKRLDIFTQRLENNKQPNATKLRDQTTQLKKDITTLTGDYEVYDSARESVSAFKDCTNKQTEFVKQLDDMRVKRQKVNDDVAMIDSLLGVSVRSNISDLYNQLLVTGTSGVSNE